MSRIKSDFGDGVEGVYSKAFTDTTPIVYSGIFHGGFDGAGLQLIVDYQVDNVTVANTDNVVASTKVFTFSNYTFTGKTGAKIKISGAANAGNNGTFTITSVTTHTATCSGASGLADETFDPTKVTVQVIRSETASVPAGTWTVACSNNYVAPSNGSTYGAAPATGTFTDISALFNSPASIAAVTDASSQYVQARLDARHLQITFTPSAGLGTATAAIYLKSWSR